MAEHARYEIIDCVVTGHAPYGLIVESVSGERGYVDSEYIGDGQLQAEDWPSVGEVISGVVLGYTQDGRIHICSQPSYVTYVRSATDIDNTQKAWARVHSADMEYVESTESLYVSDDVQVVLRWALSRPAYSKEPGIALRALMHAPSGLVLDLMSELVSLVVDDNHADEVRAAIAPVGSKMSAPVLLRSVESLLADTTLNVQQYGRLAELLISLGTTRPLEVVIAHMLASRNPAVREAGKQIQSSRTTS